MFRFAKLQIVEQPGGLELVAVPEHVEVLAYPDVVEDAHGVEISEPLLSDELPVSHEMGYRVFSCKAQEPLNEFNPLCGVGVATLVHHNVNDRECHPVVYYSEVENVNVGVAVLPVGPVHRQIVAAFNRYKF